jgi:glycosyltransferase involved in cell wall biosynthesis
MLSVIIPAHNEAALIGGCLTALLGSSGVTDIQVIIAANGCTDATATIAQSFAAQAQSRGWTLQILNLPEGNKPAALNAADAAAVHPSRAYLDADVTVSPDLLSQTIAALDREQPTYASGHVHITGHSSASRAYAAIWSRVPFMRHGVPGCGFFAVNGAGRQRWGQFPPIISDDTFVRLQFTPVERVLVPASYDWPIAEGFGNLVKVRRRQDAGVAQVAQDYPALMANDGTPALGLTGLLKLALSHPAAFAVYTAVALNVRLSPGGAEWSRGR